MTRGRPTNHLAGLPLLLRRRGFALALSSALVIACGGPKPAQRLPLPLTPQWWVPVPPMTHEPLSAVLASLAADDGTTWSASQRATLDAYLATIAHGGPRTNPELFPSASDALAYLVDAHIAWTLALGHAPPFAALDVAALQRAPITVGGETTTLERLTGEIWLRAQHEPRLRLWLNPGWKGGPPLPPSAVEGEALAWQLSRQAERCGAAPGFWALDGNAKRLAVSAYAASMWGLPDALPERTRRLLDLVPPPPALREAIIATCTEGLQRCSIVSTPFDQSRKWRPLQSPRERPPQAL
jgi:hypothetical protein